MSLEQKHELARYLGYSIIVEYAVEEVDGRWSVSFRIVEEFEPYFSDDEYGCTSVSEFRPLRSYKHRFMALRAVSEHMKNMTIEDAIREIKNDHL